MIIPHTEALGIRLTAAQTRTGSAVFEELTGLGLEKLPSRDAFTSMSLWPNGPHQQVCAQFEIVHPESGRIVGYTSLHELSPHSGYVKCSVALDPSRGGPGAATAATALTANYAFSMWNIRKIYFWTLDDSIAALDGTPIDAVKEVVFPEYVKDGDQLRTANVFAVYREQWETAGVEFVRTLAAGPPAS
ncbi:GNAT family protein [Nocardiopsis ansamitocini]|uniref:N-acetyltransferase domain-containing protein n=1 Tax=Nocardiopsis ansamitocini TaxID=1670832 RepID=A0A9W6UKS8_9ACTN|nr:GNAT family protein [Nocardiopsis ansamitocini]GLU50042.1 hypothetical protein Nans01_43930 [Nocardiopsis ansamitocini]